MNSKFRIWRAAAEICSTAGSKFENTLKIPQNSKFGPRNLEYDTQNSELRIPNFGQNLDFGPFAYTLITQITPDPSAWTLVAHRKPRTSLSVPVVIPTEPIHLPRT